MTDLMATARWLAAAEVHDGDFELRLAEWVADGGLTHLIELIDRQAAHYRGVIDEMDHHAAEAGLAAMREQSLSYHLPEGFSDPKGSLAFGEPGSHTMLDAPLAFGVPWAPGRRHFITSYGVSRLGFKVVWVYWSGLPPTPEMGWTRWRGTDG